MSATVKEKWDRNYQDSHDKTVPSSLLIEHAFLLPKVGSALDLACGLGANACFLAERGLATAAWDISTVAINKLQQSAQTKVLSIKSEIRDITSHSFIENSFNVIIISRFLDRSLSDAIMSALKPGGLLFYQTFNRQKVDANGPNNPEYLLADQELLAMFAPLKLIYYQENGRIGVLSAGFRNETQFIAQKSV